MSGSKFLIAVSVIGTMFLTACSAPGVYPITGESTSSSDPVATMMDMPIDMYTSEMR